MEVRADLIASIYAHIPRSSLGVLAGATTVVWGMWGQVSHNVLLLWLLAVFAVAGVRMALCRLRACRLERTDLVPRWERYWTWTTAAHGCIWGGAAFLMYVPHSAEYQALLLVALFAISTAAMPLVARHLPSLYAFVLPTLGPITLRLALEGTAERMFLAVMALLVMYGIFLFGHELHRTLIDSVRRRYENIDLIEALTQQTRRAESLRREADRANRMKTRFLAAASHDLRQPMHALSLFSASLRGRVVDSESAMLAGRICESATALERMFDALLDVSRLDAGAVQPRPTAFPLQRLVDRVLQECLPDAIGKGLELRRVATAAVVCTDPVLLDRILRNLVVNAIRYTDRGRVLVGCRRAGSRVRLEVWDTGIGIAPSERERVFDEFYRADDKERDGRQGLGLGLSTVARLAKLLDLRLRVASRPGLGSVFSVELPLGVEPVSVTEAHAPVAAESKGDLAGRVLLVIDDDPPALEAMAAALRSWQARAVTASDLDEALAKLPECDRYPDGIVSDYRLGGGRSGVAAVTRIRHELGLDIPALIVTGDTAAESLAAIAASGLPCLPKPVAAERLREGLAALLLTGAAPDPAREVAGSVTVPPVGRPAGCKIG